MFVKEWMSRGLITVAPNATLDEALKLMETNKIRRLPVVDGGKLVGIVTERDLMKVSPSPATTLSKYELNYILEKIIIKDIMSKKLYTINQNSTIEEAALILFNEKIGGIPVVEDSGAIVGVITETDLFKAFVNIMGLTEGKTRFTLEVENKVGIVKEIAGVFSEAGINISSMVTCHRDDDNIYELVIRANVDNTDAEIVKEKLSAKGFNVCHIAKIG